MPKAGHEGEKRYRDQKANEFLKQREKIKKWFDALYIDKIDSVITIGMNI